MWCLARPAVLATAFVLAGAQAGAQVLAQEPLAGRLRPDERVLVDDGTCPPGQIKQVIGGSNRTYIGNEQRPGTPRQVSCVPRPL